jgi:hypothetical protein
VQLPFTGFEIAIDFAVTIPMELVVPCTVTHLPTTRLGAAAVVCSVTSVDLVTGIAIVVVDALVSATVTEVAPTVFTVPTIALNVPLANFRCPKLPELPPRRPGNPPRKAPPPTCDVLAEHPFVSGRIDRARTTPVVDPDGVISIADTQSPIFNALTVVANVWENVVAEVHLTVDSPVVVP